MLDLPHPTPRNMEEAMRFIAELEEKATLCKQFQATLKAINKEISLCQKSYHREGNPAYREFHMLLLLIRDALMVQHDAYHVIMDAVLQDLQFGGMAGVN